ncbi:MAG TPA: hypothetical protein PK600_07390 [Deltaproteobacteria bacterium]|nr:hypothetical protein [Deltaproteobacteria bacterium]
MDIEKLTRFFMWCTIMNGALLVLWTVVYLLVPDLVYRMQSIWFPLPRDTYDAAMYAFLGLFKILFLVFNVVPYVALLLVGRKKDSAGLRP